jgi:tetratricopeptide (TPR) repeat protein
MEVLKIYITTVFLTFCSVFIAQSDNAIREAFKKSYESEYQLKYSKAIEDLQGIYDVNSYELNLRLGWLSYKNNKHVESVSYYKKAITKMPNSVEARLGLTYPLSAMEKWDLVIEQYKAVIKVDNGNTTANYNLALIYYNKGEYGSSWKYMQSYLLLHPFDFDGNSLAGWIKYSVGKKSEAFAFFKKALLVRPYDTSFNKVLGIN